MLVQIKIWTVAVVRTIDQCLRLQTDHSLNIFHWDLFENRWPSLIQNSSLKLSHTIMLQFQEIVKWSLCFLKQSFSFDQWSKRVFSFHLPSIRHRCWTVLSKKTLNCIIKTCIILKFILTSFDHLQNKLCLKNTC